LQRPGGKQETGLDVLVSQSLVFVQDLSLGRAMGQQIEDVFDGQPSAPDHGLTDRDPGIDLDALKQMILAHERLPPARIIQQTGLGVQELWTRAACGQG
jgi:hypothetical protein